MIEVDVEDVLVRLRRDADQQLRVPPDPPSIAADERIVILKERDGERRMPIRTGPFEGDMIALAVTLRLGTKQLV